jgi:ATP-binding cassette, subfamily F, member 3
MIYLAAERVAKHFGPEPVLAGVTAELRPGEKIGLVGPNGTGKTTLMRILAGQLDADAGHVHRHPTATLGYLEQQPDFAPGRTVWEEARSALAHLISLAEEAEQLAHAMSGADQAEHRRLGERFDRLQVELHRRDAYHLDHKIDRILTGLGFPPDSFPQPVEQLSGGQQNRLLLAKLLLAEPDVLLLDEPSNHLDIEATEWLEEYLIASRQALVVVSHDRYFLDRVTNRTWELYHGTVDAYVGNFSAYWRQKAERLEVQRRTWERQQEEIAKLEDFVRRHHYGQKAAQAEDRRKKLERIERVETPREIAAPHMRFPEASRTGDIVLRVEHLAKSFPRPEGVLPLFHGLSFDVQRGERWGILGPNGSGKTTLLRCILGEVSPDEGKVIFGAGVKVGYFDQQLLCVDADELVMDAIRPGHKEFVEQQRRDLLARFGVTGDMAYQKVGSLSGGERNRVALAMLAASDANLLVLDEPTNHLDLWARDALERAIKEFEGTVLFVSHDRYFLNRVADRLLVVEPNRFRVVEGNYDTYLHLVRVGLAGGEASIADTSRSDGKPKADGAQKKGKPPREPRRRRKFPYRKVEDLEAEIHERELRVEELHAMLATPEVLRDGEKVKGAKAEIEEQQQTLASLYAHWEEAAELNA